MVGAGGRGVADSRSATRAGAMLVASSDVDFKGLDTPDENGKPRYSDFRPMLDRHEQDIDAVCIAQRLNRSLDFDAATQRFRNDDIGFVYSKPLLDAPSSSSGHDGGNAKTYMNVGLALGEKMAELIRKSA